MAFFAKLLQILDTSMETPTPYGWFHLMFLALTAIITILLCVFGKNSSPKQIRRFVLVVTIVVILLELYKQINYSFSYDNNVVGFDYQWYIFPWQFCSTPMYVGLLAGLTKKGKIHKALCAFLSTYAIFAGVAVMLYPTTVFIRTIGINIQTMFCHGSMITVGAFLLATGYVKLEHKTILKAIPVFAALIFAAMIMNEIAFYSGLLETETFNMFFISPHCEPSLPVYSLVQQVVPYPWCLIIYIAAFTLAAYLMLLIALGIKQIVRKIGKKNSVSVA